MDNHRVQTQKSVPVTKVLPGLHCLHLLATVSARPQYLKYGLWRNEMFADPPGAAEPPPITTHPP